MFTMEHFIWIGLSISFVVAMTCLCLKEKVPLKRAGIVMCTISVFSEGSKIMSDMIESPFGGMVLNPVSLPLHLCSLMLFCVFFITFGKESKARQIVIDFVAVMGILGSICAILIPTNGTDFTTVLAYQCFVYHSGLLWFSLYLIISKQAHIGAKALLHNLLILLVLSMLMIYVNGALSAYGTNFMFLVRPPMEGLPILNLNHGWYAYFIRILLLGTVLLSLFHLPFIIHERRLCKRSQN